jgi:flavin-binding protein dodecin
MSVAKNIEITSSSTISFEDAINTGIARASKSLNNVRGAWIKEQKISIMGGKVSEYRVMMILTFVLDGDEAVEEEVKTASTKKAGKSSKGKKK